MGYRVGTYSRGRQTVHTLHDDETGASAAVLPGYGFNLFDLRLPVAGEVRPVLVAEDDFAENPRGGAGNGTPILFPFPNRIRGGSFTYGGRGYKLPLNAGANAIHGFAVDASWQVVEHRATATSARIVGRYQISQNSPEMLPNWPADAVLMVQFDLAGRQLTMSVTVSNPTALDLPYGFGIHPYFRLSSSQGGGLEETRVIIPAAQYWVLEEFLPTGEIRPVEPRLDFRGGQALAGLKLDDVLTGLEFTGDHAVCRLVNPAQKAEFQLGFDRGIRELVVYTPPSRPGVISMEPYTQTTDAINLQARGGAGGLRVLHHGQKESFVITMSTREPG